MRGAAGSTGSYTALLNCGKRALTSSSESPRQTPLWDSCRKTIQGISVVSAHMNGKHGREWTADILGHCSKELTAPILLHVRIPSCSGSFESEGSST